MHTNITDWEFCQNIFHQMTKNHSDELGDWEYSKIDGKYLFLRDCYVGVNKDEVIIEKAIDYIVNSNEVMYYPAKSYAVAIVYAKLLEKYFKEDFYKALSSPRLLYYNDDCFVPYLQDKIVYDRIIEGLPPGCLEEIEDKSKGVMSKTIAYFYKEFLLEGEMSLYSPETPKRSILISN